MSDEFQNLDSQPTGSIDPIPKKRRGRPKGDKTTYYSYTEAEVGTGIPKKRLQLAAKVGAPGIQHNRIDWDVFGPWYEKNKQEIESGVATESDQLSSYKKIRELIDYDLDIQKKRKEVIEPDAIRQWTANLAALLSAALKQKKLQLESKCTGYEKIIHEEFIDIFKVIEKELKTWQL